MVYYGKWSTVLSNVHTYLLSQNYSNCCNNYLSVLSIAYNIGCHCTFAQSKSCKLLMDEKLLLIVCMKCEALVHTQSWVDYHDIYARTVTYITMPR